MTIKVGDRLPEVALQRISNGVETLDTRTLFEHRKVVIFAVPGAFTPTCSEKHLPGFVEHFEDFRERHLRRGRRRPAGTGRGARRVPGVVRRAPAVGAALIEPQGALQ